MIRIYQTYIARLDQPNSPVFRHFTTNRSEAVKVARSMLRSKEPLDEIGILEMRGFDVYQIERL